MNIDHGAIARRLASDFGATEESIQVTRVKQDGASAVVAVRFTDGAGRPRRAALGVSRTADGWLAQGGCSHGEPGALESSPAWQVGGFSVGERRRARVFWVTGPVTSLTLTTSDGSRHSDASKRVWQS